MKGAKPSTLSDYDYLLREPGTPYKRGDRVSKGRILSAFGDRDVREVTPREVEQFLASLDAEGLAPRNVNKHRALLCAVFAYAQRVDSYELPTNPAAMTNKRREALPAVLEFYEPHEVELLAETVASGTWRKDRPDLSSDERLMRAEEDARDGDLFRVLFFTGLRLGELRALRWGAVDLEGRVLLVKAALSVGVEVDPKGPAYRWTPLTTGAVDALQRHLDRSGTLFTTLDDYVFCGRFGEPLDAGALRRRYKAARDKAGLRDVKLHRHERHPSAIGIHRSLLQYIANPCRTSQFVPAPAHPIRLLRALTKPSG